MEQWLFFATTSAATATSSTSQDGWLFALANFGGMGVLAGVLFYLHTMTMKNHREDIAREREQYRMELAAERKICGDFHEKIIARFDAQAKVLETLSRTIDSNHRTANARYHQTPNLDRSRPSSGPMSSSEKEDDSNS